MMGVLEEPAERENISKGGSALTDDTDVAVSMTGRSAPRAVITATPEGWWRKAALKFSDETETSLDAEPANDCGGRIGAASEMRAQVNREIGHVERRVAASVEIPVDDPHP